MNRFHELVVKFECGKYFYVTKDKDNIDPKIDEIERDSRKNYCTHKMVGLEFNFTTNSQNLEKVIYSGNCAFGA